MLTLYYKPTCPFCQRVLAQAEALGITFNLKNVAADELLQEELIAKGGKKQVPFVVDEERGEALYESEAIVAYLLEHYTEGGTQAAASPRLTIHRSDASCDVCE